ncbi:MAG: hypothetical protein ACLRZG_00410 [Streptococcus sp.]
MDAKFAYFYTPEEPSMIIREYYKNKALSLFSNETFSDEETGQSEQKVF